MPVDNPPDPDFPVPVAYNSADTYTTFRVDFVGMTPHVHQADNRWTIGAKSVGVFMTYEVSATGYSYRGIGTSKVSLLHPNTSASFVGTYQPDESTRTETASLSSGSWAGSVSTVTKTDLGGGQIKLSVTANVPSTGGTHYAVAVPNVAAMPTYSSFAAYLETGGWSTISAGSASTADVTVKPGNLTAYVVFLATGMPSAPVIRSAAKGVTL